MRKLIAFCVVFAVAVTANQAFAQSCPTCAGSVPTFSQPATSYAAPPQIYNAPVETYAAPVQHVTPIESYPAVSCGAAPVYSAPVEYLSAPVSSGCSSCGTCCSGGSMSPYSTTGLPPGAVIISDVVSGEGASVGNVEGTVIDSATSKAGSPTEAAEPPAPTPTEDKAVPTLPTEDTDTTEAAKETDADDGT